MIYSSPARISYKHENGKHGHEGGEPLGTGQRCVEAHKSSQLTEEHPLQRGRYDGNIIQRKHTRKPGETMAREESFTLGLLQSASSDAADRRTSSI